MTANNNTRREKNILILCKGDEKYVFIYDNAGEAETLRKFGQYAANQELSFSWYDAAVLSQRVKFLRDQSLFNCEVR